MPDDLMTRRVEAGARHLVDVLFERYPTIMPVNWDACPDDGRADVRAFVQEVLAAADAVGPGEAEREACLQIVKATYEQWERDYEDDALSPGFWIGAEGLVNRIIEALTAPSPEQG